MRNARFLVASAIAVTLAGCDMLTNSDAEEPLVAATAAAPSPTPSVLPTPLTEAEVAVIREEISQAVDAVPPELRNEFQKAFTCDAAKNPSPMTADRIRKLTERLKADRSIARC